MLINPSKLIFDVDLPNFFIPFQSHRNCYLLQTRCVHYLKKIDCPPMGSYHTLNLPNNSTDHPVLKLSFHLSSNSSITCLQSKKCVYFMHHCHPTTWSKYSAVQWVTTGPVRSLCMSSGSDWFSTPVHKIIPRHSVAEKLNRALPLFDPFQYPFPTAVFYSLKA